MRIIVRRNDPKTMHAHEVGQMHEGTAIDESVTYHNYSLNIYNLRQKSSPLPAYLHAYIPSVLMSTIASIRIFVFDTIGSVRQGMDFSDKTKTLQLL